MVLFLFSGCFSALFAIVAELAVFSFLVPSGAGIDSWHLGLVSGLSVITFLTFALVAVIEESMKFIVLNRQIGQMTGTWPWAPPAIFGLGFAVTEITLASMTAGVLNPPTSVAGILVLHILTSVLYGHAAPLGKKRVRTALAAGIAIHLLYDILLALV